MQTPSPSPIVDAPTRSAVFVDGAAGTTGLGINERLRLQNDVVVKTIAEDKRKDAGAKRALMEQVDLVILCLPDDAARETVALIEAMGNRAPRILDASTAHRVASDWTYGFPELAPDQPGKIRNARKVSNPGCYPTAANLAIRPLLDSQVVDRRPGIVCDAKSGVSGAGRKPSLKTSFCEVTENFSAYSILDHRHVPEVLLTSGLEEAEFSFTAQLIPIDRGILETIYLRVNSAVTADKILEVYRERYHGEPFIRLYKPGHVPDLRAVQRTNFCDIGFKFDAVTGRLVVVSAIDNLVKGAAGQAIQNLNLMLGFAETEALL